VLLGRFDASRHKWGSVSYLPPLEFFKH
jgi:hypothetical protein